jgi:hypothetical protein
MHRCLMFGHYVVQQVVGAVRLLGTKRAWGLVSLLFHPANLQSVQNKKKNMRNVFDFGLRSIGFYRFLLDGPKLAPDWPLGPVVLC